MSRIKTIMIVGLTVILAASFSITSAFAASGNKPETNPPYGVEMHGAAKGTKLIGVLHMELIKANSLDDFYSTMFATIRLRKGSEALARSAGPLFGEFKLANESDIQDALTGGLGEKIITAFFPGECFQPDPNIIDNCMTLYLKDISDWAQTPIEGGVTSLLIDVVLAAE